jgi:hypothetical protein
LKELDLRYGALNDHKMSFLFRGLTRSTIQEIGLDENGFSVAGVRCMVPFLTNSNNLTKLNLNSNNIQSEGFNMLLRALRDNPIEKLYCSNCGIESIEIDNDYIPRNVKFLDLYGNRINADGCRELVKLLQGGDSTLTALWLKKNKIDDEGVAILVDALQKNTSLVTLDLQGNDDISIQGQIMLLKLLNDISSIKATLQSNHTLQFVTFEHINDEIRMCIDMALTINWKLNPEIAGRAKVICTHLRSENRALLCRLQEVDHSVYSEIDPLHLPEVLSLIGRRHGQGELYAALSSSIMTLLATVNRKKRIQHERAYHAAKAAEHRAKMEELDAELAAIEGVEGGSEVNEEIEHRSSKRRRKW